VYLVARKWEKSCASAGAGVEPIRKILSCQEVEVEVRNKLVEMFKFVVCHGIICAYGSQKHVSIHM